METITKRVKIAGNKFVVILECGRDYSLAEFTSELDAVTAIESMIGSFKDKLASKKIIENELYKWSKKV
jgi:hypothetical protein